MLVLAKDIVHLAINFQTKIKFKKWETWHLLIYLFIHTCIILNGVLPYNKSKHLLVYSTHVYFMVYNHSHLILV